MAGSLTLTVGPISASVVLGASNATLEAGVRNAAEELGYGALAQTDPAQQVANWFVQALVNYARDASKGFRISGAVKIANNAESAVVDPFEV